MPYKRNIAIVYNNTNNNSQLYLFKFNNIDSVDYIKQVTYVNGKQEAYEVCITFSDACCSTL